MFESVGSCRNVNIFWGNFKCNLKCLVSCKTHYNYYNIIIITLLLL